MAVETVELRPFELELIESFKVFNPIAGTGGKATPRKGIWIRGHLANVGEDYTYGMWLRWRRFTETAEFMTASIEPGDYGAFRVYVWLLKREDLIRPTRIRPASKTPVLEFQRSYYALNPAQLGSPLWENPYATYDSWQRWKRRKFKRPEARRKKAKPGRPPKRTVGYTR